MFTTRPAEPVSGDDKVHTQSRGPTFAAAFRYTERDMSLSRSPQGAQTATMLENRSATDPSPQRPNLTIPLGMNGYTATPDPPPALYVRALYNYDADDQTSLSFRQGDIIQVLTQLESGWWDGVINDVRGWFPSNYCAVISGPDDPGDLGLNRLDASDTSGDSGVDEEEYDEHDEELDSDGNPRDVDSDLPIEGAGAHDQEEAAFWVPQATPDGRLYYFNTLTGVSKMELPLETPMSPHEVGPHDRTNFHVPDQTRPPPEMMARGLENDEEDYDGSASEAEAEGEPLMLSSHSPLPDRNASLVSASPSGSTSMESINEISPQRNNILSGQHVPGRSGALPSLQQTVSVGHAGTSATSFANLRTDQLNKGTMQPRFADDGVSKVATWATLIENMRQSVEAYRSAIRNRERSEYVRKAEDISDHLRMLLAAGSGTTDNHSGNPSIISTNKALYPHFRDMMSRFSKLVLSSHIAAADWPGPDALAKCLQEADGVLHGVYGYVEIARQQRGDDIPRLVPGFILGATTGGNWRTNTIGQPPDAGKASSFMTQDDAEIYAESPTTLDADLLNKINATRKVLLTNLHRLQEQLQLTEKLITPTRQAWLGETICIAMGAVINSFRPWIILVESMNLSTVNNATSATLLAEFSSLKQKAYDSVAELVSNCQSVTSPLADEWTGNRGSSLEDRLIEVERTSRSVESMVSQISYSLQLFLDRSNTPGPAVPHREHRMTDGGEIYQKAHLPAHDEASRRPQLGNIGQSQSYSVGSSGLLRQTNSDKAQQFFGQMPPPNIQDVAPGTAGAGEEIPWFLQLDQFGEVSYDLKCDPPQLKSGTLRGLVEQLTRHDRLDASFNGTFLLTYRSFTTASELFELLLRRFSLQPPPGLSRDEYTTWEDRKQKLVRLRVVNILKSWVENYWMEGNDETSQELLERCYAFAKTTISSTKTPGSQQLMAVVDQRLKGQDNSSKRLVLTLTNSAPPPILPKNMKKLKFLDIDVTEFARQLTIIESKLYGKIKPTECLDKTWQRKVKSEDGLEPAPNVKSLILHSNQLTNWVAEMILSQAEVKKRVIVIKHFVAIADKCRALNNFSTLTSIVSALGTAPILRLNRTWAQVPLKTGTVLEQMRTLMASTKNFGKYREKLHEANPPCIPFLGVYLTDLTFIEDGIASIIKSTDLINFTKRTKTAEVIRDIQQYQNVPYTLNPVSDLQEWILDRMRSAADVHEMYEQSLKIEPREREEEKIARLLSESGFL